MRVETRSAAETCRDLIRRAYEKPFAVYEKNCHLDPEGFKRAILESWRLMDLANDVYLEVYAGRKTVDDFKEALRAWWKLAMRLLREAAAEGLRKSGGAAGPERETGAAAGAERREPWL